MEGRGKDELKMHTADINAAYSSRTLIRSADRIKRLEGSVSVPNSKAQSFQERDHRSRQRSTLEKEAEEEENHSQAPTLEAFRLPHLKAATCAL